MSDRSCPYYRVFISFRYDPPIHHDCFSVSTAYSCAYLYLEQSDVIAVSISKFFPRSSKCVHVSRWVKTSGV